MNTLSKAALAASIAFASICSQAETTISTKGGLTVTSDPYEFKFGGRIMYDYDRSELNGDAVEDGFALRRGRIFISGKVAEDWSFKSQYEFEDSSIRDMYVRYSGWGPKAVLTMGNQKLPFGQEVLQSSKDMSTLERSAASEFFGDGRKESVNLSGRFDGNQNYSVSVYSDDPVDGTDSDNQDIGFAARYSVAPIKTDSSLLHLGVAYRDIDEAEVVGLELGGVLGSWHAEAEYFEGELGATDEDGYYLKLGYILTGEVRPYSTKNGVFGKVKSNKESGAWEIVARYDDEFGKHSDVELGTTFATSYTLGVNWYANNNIRAGINYTHGESNLTDDDGNELRARIQLSF